MVGDLITTLVPRYLGTYLSSWTLVKVSSSHLQHATRVGKRELQWVSEMGQDFSAWVWRNGLA